MGGSGGGKLRPRPPSWALARPGRCPQAAILDPGTGHEASRAPGAARCHPAGSGGVGGGSARCPPVPGAPPASTPGLASAPHGAEPGRCWARSRYGGRERPKRSGGPGEKPRAATARRPRYPDVQTRGPIKGAPRGSSARSHWCNGTSIVVETASKSWEAGSARSAAIRLVEPRARQEAAPIGVAAGVGRRGGRGGGGGQSAALFVVVPVALGGGRVCSARPARDPRDPPGTRRDPPGNAGIHRESAGKRREPAATPRDPRAR